MSATTPDSRLAALSLAALGVVYGDIGTSPLYAIKEVFGGAHHPVPITPDNVLGILSLIFWSLMIVVSLKYVTFITRADNRGEGGIMALMALALRPTAPGSTRRRLIILLGLFGAALFYGDGVITPAISVLSAVEGLEVATPAFQALRAADLVDHPDRRCSPCSVTAPPPWAISSDRSWCCGS
jgi:KUP system potassium uptake protein